MEYYSDKILPPARGKSRWKKVLRIVRRFGEIVTIITVIPRIFYARPTRERLYGYRLDSRRIRAHVVLAITSKMSSNEFSMNKNFSPNEDHVVRIIEEIFASFVAKAATPTARLFRK